jgi:hypothetical protein
VRDFLPGDQVEILAPWSDKGGKGIVTSTSRDECVVKITSSGTNHAMTKKIGKKTTYPKTSLRMI